MWVSPIKIPAFITLLSVCRAGGSCPHLTLFQPQYNEAHSAEDQVEAWFCLVAPPCPTLYDPMECSMPGSPVLHHLPEFAQIHVH